MQWMVVCLETRLHGCKHQCTFCRMKHHWTWCDYFQILLLGIRSSMEPTIYFQILDRCCDGRHFPGFGKYIYIYIYPKHQTCTALVLSAGCAEFSCLPNLVIFNNFLVFNFPFLISSNIFLFFSSLDKYSLFIFNVVLHYQLNAFKIPKIV